MLKFEFPVRNIHVIVIVVYLARFGGFVGATIRLGGQTGQIESVRDCGRTHDQQEYAGCKTI